MIGQSKEDAARVTSIRRLGQLKYVAWIPMACMVAACGWLKRLLVSPGTPAELRAADKGHQSEVRREMRGLSPVHDADKHVG